MMLAKSFFSALPKWRELRKTPAPLQPGQSPDIAEASPVLEDGLFVAAEEAIASQLHTVIDNNADGINRSARTIRDQSDMLLSLGITDERVARAGTLAQLAVELANSGRGVNLQQVAHAPEVEDRRRLVVKAMATIAQAEGLISAAAADNKKSIRSAVAKQERMLSAARANPLTKSLLK
ncbi:hypothetical protein [Herbaspirillum sp.]|uniref:hypothetical protein n=1 Tax=Herbaspirillum sp. TaxID=1890675 RepID=UPI000C0B660A|nr:hypothetical protein [Herbaspirillum sp.]MAF04671.1 hypothetical protein [Herbaspirillum sp.]|tara:strand:+ start:3803 stop:4339 length:537 start_codon:yes stop_codon:yes gene_type:complete